MVWFFTLHKHPVFKKKGLWGKQPYKQQLNYALVLKQPTNIILEFHTAYITKDIYVYK